MKDRFRSFIGVLLLGVFLYFVLPAHSVLAVSQQLNLDLATEPQATPVPTMFGLLIRLTLSLIFIAGLAFLTMKILRKNMKVLSKGNHIRILDQYAMGMNKGIYIAQIAGKVYVLGITDHNINPISKITDQDMIEELINNADDRDNEPLIPTSLIERLFPGTISPKVQNTRSFKAHIQKQIKRLQTVVENRANDSREDKKHE